MGPIIIIFTGNKATSSLQKGDKIIYLGNKGDHNQRGLFSKIKKKKALSARKKKIKKQKYDAVNHIQERRVMKEKQF